eukprot:jgi/Ulvmu1/11380/UM075_0042.1
MVAPRKATSVRKSIPSVQCFRLARGMAVHPDDKQECSHNGLEPQALQSYINVPRLTSSAHSSSLERCTYRHAARVYRQKVPNSPSDAMHAGDCVGAMRYRSTWSRLRPKPRCIGQLKRTSCSKGSPESAHLPAAESVGFHAPPITNYKLELRGDNSIYPCTVKLPSRHSRIQHFIQARVMTWVRNGRGAASSACVHGAVASRAPTVQSAKRSVNAAMATDVPVQQDVMSLHRVATRRSLDPAKPDGLRSNGSGSRQGLHDIFEMRARPASGPPRSVLERGWAASPSKVVRSVNRRNRRVRGSSCPARTPFNEPRKPAGFAAADTFLASLEGEIADATRTGCDHQFLFLWSLP